MNAHARFGLLAFQFSRQAVKELAAPFAIQRRFDLTQSGAILADVGKVPQMLIKRKLPLLPKRAAATQTRQLFDRAEEEENRRR